MLKHLSKSKLVKKQEINVIKKFLHLIPPQSPVYDVF